MNRNSILILAAFALGQAVQILFHALSMDLWPSRQIPVCAAAGFLVAVAIFGGMWVAWRDMRGGRHL